MASLEHSFQTIENGGVHADDAAELSVLKSLPPQLQELVKVENEDESNKIWGFPYRWGTTVIAYRKDILEEKNIEPPKDWQDLWNEDFKNNIGLLNQPREIIGLTLKKLGYSYNLDNLDEVSDLKSELIKLNQQAKFYASNYYLQPLILGDIWVSVGWSSDILAIKKSYPNIGVIIPPSGTSLWAEMWVQAKNNPSLNDEKKDLIQKWIDFCWKAESASEISLFTSSTSPIISILNPDEIPADIMDNPLLNINPEILNKSEFIKPIAEEIKEKYLALWKEVTL